MINKILEKYVGFRFKAKTVLNIFKSLNVVEVVGNENLTGNSLVHIFCTQIIKCHDEFSRYRGSNAGNRKARGKRFDKHDGYSRENETSAFWRNGKRANGCVWPHSTFVLLPTYCENFRQPVFLFPRRRVGVCVTGIISRYCILVSRRVRISENNNAATRGAPFGRIRCFIYESECMTIIIIIITAIIPTYGDAVCDVSVALSKRPRGTVTVDKTSRGHWRRPRRRDSWPNTGR